MLPGGSGIQFIKHLKREAMTRDIPVMMLTARGEEEDRVRGLEVGADDYITKPFSPKELVARIKAVMRRISPMAVEEVIEIQGLSLDPSSHRVMSDTTPLEMGPTEYKLLHFYDAPGARLQPRTAVEQRLGHQRLRRRSHGGRAYTPPAQSTGADRTRSDGANRTWNGVSFLRALLIGVCLVLERLSGRDFYWNCCWSACRRCYSAC